MKTDIFTTIQAEGAQDGGSAYVAGIDGALIENEAELIELTASALVGATRPASLSRARAFAIHDTQLDEVALANAVGVMAMFNGEQTTSASSFDHTIPEVPLLPLAKHGRHHQARRHGE